MFIPAVSRGMFNCYMIPSGQELETRKLCLGPSDYFLIGRLSMNIKGSTMEEVLSELYQENKEERLVLSIVD